MLGKLGWDTHHFRSELIGALGFVGPLQSYTTLNNTYYSVPQKGQSPTPSITVAGGALSSAGKSPCK